MPSLGLHHPEILSLGVATFKGGRSGGDAAPAEAVVPLVYDRRAAARKPRKTARES